MENYGSNSNASKVVEATQTQKKFETPATENVKVKKENGLAKKFFAQDIKSTASGVANDVVIPGLKNLIVTILKKGVDYLFLGAGYSTPNNTNYSSYSVPRNISYAPGYNPNQSSFGIQAANQKASIYAVNDIVFNNRGDAEEVLSRMCEALQKYESVSVADFYDLIGKPSPNHTDNNYGWKNLSTATVDRTQDGYRIKFPRVIALD